MNNKRCVAFLLNYLYENTDMDHPVSSVQLQKILKEKGYAYDPRTIRKDVNLLAEAGFDIIINEKSGQSTEYSYGVKDWEMSEVRVLIDAVSSAQFITREKTDILISKLSTLAGRQHAEMLIPQVCVSEHIKAQNNILMYTIEKVSLAIKQKKKISFKMFNYNTDKQKVLRHGGEVYVISPYHTVWNDDRYYVVGYSDKRQDIVTMRIDRMDVPEIMTEDAVPPPAGYNVQDYTDTFTKMYGGARQEVVLRCCNTLIDQVIDKFGTGVRLSGKTPYTFDATVTAAVSGTFLSWVFQYAGQITILSPEPVRKMYAEMLRTAMADMDDSSVSRFKESADLVWKL